MRYQCRKAQGFKSLCEQTWSSVRVVKELASGASAETRKGSSPLVTKFLSVEWRIFWFSVSPSTVPKN